VGGSEGLVAEIAGAILDGTTVDWASVESSANPTERSFLEHLRVVAAVADIHRQPFVATATSSVPRLDEPASHGAMLEQWGQLRVLERIGRGAFGEVFRAWDSRLDREVALKLLPADATHALLPRSHSRKAAPRSMRSPPRLQAPPASRAGSPRRSSRRWPSCAACA
jgi:hypothetical protein